MALYHKWDVKNGLVYVLTFFSLISDGLGSVIYRGLAQGLLCTMVGISNICSIFFDNVIVLLIANIHYLHQINALLGAFNTYTGV